MNEHPPTSAQASAKAATQDAAPAATPCDIAIVGAGPAGVTAAVAARRAGAGRVVLIEQSDTLGGAVTHAMHRCICGLYADKPAHLTHTLNAGLQREVVSRMAALAPDQVHVKQMGKAHVLEFPPHAWQAVLQSLCDEAGVERHLQTALADIHVQRKNDDTTGDHIDNLVLEQRHTHAKSNDTAKPICFALSPRIVIDATGQGHLLNRLGPNAYLATDDSSHSSECSHAAHPSRMMGGYAMRLANLTGDTNTLRLQIPFALAKAVSQNLLPDIARLTVFHPGPAAGQGVCKMAISPADLLEKDIVATRAIAIFNHLKQTIDAMAQATIAEQSPTPQARDGLRLRGKAILTLQNVLDPTPANDPNAIKAWWPVEQWLDASGPTYQYSPANRPYHIPTDTLRSQTVDNLLAAGMNISAHQQAAASLRASGICLAIGDAAGRVAQTMLHG